MTVIYFAILSILGILGIPVALIVELFKFIFRIKSNPQDSGGSIILCVYGFITLIVVICFLAGRYL